jgi:hypothetical protein
MSHRHGIRAEQRLLIIQKPNWTNKMMGNDFTKNCENQKNQSIFDLKLKIQILQMKIG